MSQAQPQVQSNQEEAPKKKNNRFLIVLILLVLAGTVFGLTKYIHSLHHQETDDAQIEANISPVIPRIPGYITEVRVKDNQVVRKGDTLLILDNRDEQIMVAQAEAALAAAQGNLGAAQATSMAAHSNIGSSKANISSVNSQIEAAKVNVWRATQDYERYANLVKDHSITQQQYEQALAAKQTAEQQLQGLVDQKKAVSEQSNATTSQSNATEQQINVVSANIKQKQAELDNAKLNLSYTIVTAPQDGYVSKVNVQVGQYVQSGQSLFSIVSQDAPWVVANFKETQLSKMKEGQKVIVHVDAFSDHDFEAKLTSFSPATGARFALLPPDACPVYIFSSFFLAVFRATDKLKCKQGSNNAYRDVDVKYVRPGEMLYNITTKRRAQCGAYDNTHTVYGLSHTTLFRRIAFCNDSL